MFAIVKRFKKKNLKNRTQEHKAIKKKDKTEAILKESNSSFRN